MQTPRRTHSRSMFCLIGAMVLALLIVNTGVFAGDETAPDIPVLTAAARTAQASQRGPRRRRRDRSDASTSAEPGLSTDVLAQACDYLRKLGAGANPAAAIRSAWHVFYDRCDASIGRFARRMGLRGVDVDDCRQDVWADLLRSLPDFKLDTSRGRFSTWLYTIVRSKAADIVRKRSRQPMNTDPTSTAAALAAAPGRGDADPAVQCQQKADREAVRLAIDQLRQIASEQSFRVMQLRWMEERNVQEVAGILGMTPGQVWVREHRMKRKLRELFERQTPTSMAVASAVEESRSLSIPLRLRGATTV